MAGDGALYDTCTKGQLQFMQLLRVHYMMFPENKVWMIYFKRITLQFKDSNLNANTTYRCF